MKKIIFGAAALAAFIGFASALVSCGSSNSPSSPAATATPTATSTPFYSAGPTTVVSSGIGSIYGIAYDSFSTGGNLWFVADSTPGTIYQYTPAGSLVSSSQYYTGTSSYISPIIVVTDPSGNLYVSDYGNNQIDILTSAGTYEKSITGVTKPYGMAINSAGTTLYVSEDTTPGTFLTYSITAGIFYNSVANSFPTSGAYDTSRGANLAVDAGGNVYAADNAYGIIYKYGPTGAGGVTFMPSTTSTDPWGLAIDSSGNIFATEETTPNYVQEYTSTGSASVSIGGFASGASLRGIAVDGSGNLFISDNFHQYVYEVKK
jgi:serine/threonine-protein kinase